jgi:hypothetical protein
MARFKPGESGNPRGRPRGSSKVSKYRAMLEPHADAVIEAVVQKALDGDVAAMRLILERLVPSLKSRDLPSPLPALDSGTSLAQQGYAVLAEVSAGRLTPSEASSLLKALGDQAKVIEITDLIKRVEALEAANDKR